MSTDTAKTEPAATTNGKSPLLEADHVQLYFPIKQGVLIDRTVGHVHAVDDVSLGLNEGETLGVVGESGCGKSTLARCFVRLLEPTAGAIRYRGKDITHLNRKALDPMRREVQLVFQDPVVVAEPAQAGRADHRHAPAPARDGRPARWRSGCATCSAASV